jgi:CheY-like chemotaxis protein
MNILVVEDDRQELDEVLPVCSQEDSVQTAGTCQDAISTLDHAWPEVIISDAIFPAWASEYSDRYRAFMVGAFLDKLRDAASKRKKKLPKVILISGAAEAAEHFPEIAAWLADGRLYDVVPKAGQLGIFPGCLNTQTQQSPPRCKVCGRPPECGRSLLRDGPLRDRYTGSINATDVGSHQKACTGR